MKYQTPGPWYIQDGDIRSDYGFVIEKIDKNCANNADARLISAAPELLEIAKNILKEWESPTDGVARGELIGRLSQYAIEARKVIKKAEGK